MTAPHIDHIGVIVADLELAAEKLRPLFGECTAIRELPEVGLRVAELRASNVVIELLQYLPGVDSAFAKSVMGERLGVNHFSVRVDDVEHAVADLTNAGFRPMRGFPRAGSHGRVAFFEPDRLSGLLLEVCQPFGAKDDSHGG